MGLLLRRTPRGRPRLTTVTAYLADTAAPMLRGRFPSEALRRTGNRCPAQQTGPTCGPCGQTTGFADLLQFDLCGVGFARRSVEFLVNRSTPVPSGLGRNPGVLPKSVEVPPVSRIHIDPAQQFPDRLPRSGTGYSPSGMPVSRPGSSRPVPALPQATPEISRRLLVRRRAIQCPYTRCTAPLSRSEIP